jgi:hypothetical protein
MVKKYTRLTAASLAIATLTLAACKGDAAKQDSLTKDSALAASLALASADSASKLTLSDTAKGGGMTKAPTTGTKAKTKTPPKTTPAPIKTTPTPTKTAPAPAAPTMGSIAAGTTIALTSNAKVCTNTNAVGDAVTATTSEAISGSNGVAIPAGATVNMTVTKLKRSENTTDKVIMEFRVISVAFNGKSYPIEASIADADVTKIRDEPKGKDVQKVAIGAAAGAIAGKILGKSTKGAVIGAAAGGAAGAGVAVATANYQGCINQGARIVVKLDAPLQLTVGTQ